MMSKLNLELSISNSASCRRRWPAVIHATDAHGDGVSAGCASNHVSNWSRTAFSIDCRTIGLTRFGRVRFGAVEVSSLASALGAQRSFGRPSDMRTHHGHAPAQKSGLGSDTCRSGVDYDVMGGCRPSGIRAARTQCQLRPNRISVLAKVWDRGELCRLVL